MLYNISTHCYNVNFMKGRVMIMIPKVTKVERNPMRSKKDRYQSYIPAPTKRKKLTATFQSSKDTVEISAEGMEALEQSRQN